MSEHLRVLQEGALELLRREELENAKFILATIGELALQQKKDGIIIINTDGQES